MKAPKALRFLFVSLMTAVLLTGCAASSVQTASKTPAASAAASAASPTSAPTTTPTATPTAAPTATPAATPTPTAAPAIDYAGAAVSAAEKEGYSYIGGKQYKGTISRSEGASFYMYAGKISFGKGYLGYAVHDFDKDGENEILLLTVENELNKAELYNSMQDCYDFRFHLYEVASDGSTKEASEIMIPVFSLPVDETCDFFYKDYDDHVGLFYALNGYEWADDGGAGSLQEYAYQNGKLSCIDNTFAVFGEDTGYVIDPDAIKELYGEKGLKSLKDFDFSLANTGYKSPMIVDQDSSCIRIARIESTTTMDQQDVTDTDDLSDVLTYTVYDYTVKS